MTISCQFFDSHGTLVLDLPTAAIRPCRVCHALGCTTHPRQAWAHARPTPRITGRRLQLLRQQLFAKQHYRCATCQQVTLHLIRDHIQPLAEGGQDIPENTQALCEPCHQVKTEAESQRGVQRSRFS